jgi:Flp pilus assembly pilin Flp
MVYYFRHVLSLAGMRNIWLISTPHRQVQNMSVLPLLSRLWSEDQGQDIAEYAVMLAVILVLVVGTVRMIGSNANGVFSQAASAIQ